MKIRLLILVMVALIISFPAYSQETSLATQSADEIKIDQKKLCGASGKAFVRSEKNFRREN